METYPTKENLLCTIRPATGWDASGLTRIAFASKRHWNYPEEYIEIWKDELTVTTDYVDNNIVFVGEAEGKKAGFYSLVTLEQDLEAAPSLTLEKGTWLHHMFIFPDHIGCGIGSALFNHLIRWCQSKGILQVRLLADPNAKGFYEKMGCKYIKEMPSSIPKRTTPLLKITIF